MQEEKRIENIVNNISSRGSEINALKYIKKSMELISKDRSLCEIFLGLNEEIIELSSKFLYAKNMDDLRYTSALSTSIYLPDYKENGEYKLTIVGGTLKRDGVKEVSYESLFDIASITKLFTLILLFILEEEKIIDLNSKIKDINPKYKGLQDFTFNDLIRLCGEVKTYSRIDEASNMMEAYKLLNGSKLASDNRNENKYTDMGAIIMGDTIEKVLSDIYKVNMTYDKIMKKYLFNRARLGNTTFNPKFDNVVGLGYVHDPKARILGGCVGSAGLFTNSEDLDRLAKSLFSGKLISKEHLDRLGEITFPNSKQSNHGNLGIFVKNKDGLNKTYTPSILSNGSFSSEGYTGCLGVFDPNNLIHFNVLVNAICDDKSKTFNNKVKGYLYELKKYENELAKYSLLMRIIKNYYNSYTDEKVDIQEMKLI